ncbi:MAG: VanZ family protein, partial [Clostridia bacterium]|nr:VanZ family protein [Clostridia bacterium]
MYRKIFSLTMTLLWMYVIFSFSAKSAAESGADSMFITDYIIRFFINNPSQYLLDIIETIIRKLAHFTEYAVLGALVCYCMRSFGVGIKLLAYSILICFVYAVSDEVHQYFVPGRACRVYDMLVDT